MKRFTCTLLASAIAALFGAGVTNAGLLVSEKEIRRQARVEWLSTKRHVPQVPDQRIQRYVSCVANSLLAELPKEFADIDWEVIVFDDDSANASADANGKIAVLSGLLDVADTPDMLAAVIGHEIAHTTQNHVMARAKQGVRTDMLVMLGSAATGIRSDMLRSGAVIGLSLPYARDQETEADLVGLRYMANAGFDPRAAMYLWKNMSARNKGTGRPPEMLSTHPADDTRLDNIVKAITPALVQYNAALDAGKRPNCQAGR